MIIKEKKFSNDIGKMRGTYIFKIFDAESMELLETVKKHNLITGNLKTTILQWLNYSEEVTPPANDFLDLKYIALGDGVTVPVASNTILENELFRKPYSNKSYTGNILEFVVSLGTSEANFTITEIGIFANGTSATDSGTLTSRSIVNIEKNENKIVNIYYRLELI